MKTTHPIIFFDGVCNLCNGGVQRIIRYDTQSIFRFTSLQSDTAQLLLSYREEILGLSSIVVLYGDQVWTKSDAILFVLKTLGWPYKLGLIGYILPRIVRDAMYDVVAKYRYRIFGRSDTCMMPSPDIAGRFI